MTDLPCFVVVRDLLESNSADGKDARTGSSPARLLNDFVAAR
jgi:hypothetical protein